MNDRELTIVSGGQTGADRAALDFAIEHSMPHGGWCPRGRIAEDGRLAPCYRLQETDTSRYDVRTRLNVDQTDATVVFSPTAHPTGGTQLTLAYARRRGKPVLHLVQSAKKPTVAHAAALRGLIETYRVTRLNIAGPRASQASEIGDFVRNVLQATFCFEQKEKATTEVA